MSNRNLHAAKRTKNDEFFTRIDDVAAELSLYASYLEGAHIYLPCDDDSSAFWQFLMSNFDVLGLAQLTATRFAPGGNAFVLDSSDGQTTSVRQLVCDGDFFSDECQELMHAADVIITNPPFSLLREFFTSLMEAGKNFIILAPIHAITYKCIFPHIKTGQVRLGHMGIKAMQFDTESGERSVSCIWMTSYPIIRECKKLELTHKYDPERYPTYDNYSAIEVSRCKDIPVDYDGIMGVPITFLNYWNPDEYVLRGHEHDVYGNGGIGVSHGQFEVEGGADIRGSSFRIIGISEQAGIGLSDGVRDVLISTRHPLINGHKKFERLLIRKEQA